MKRHNVNKAPAIRAVMSMIMATAIFLSSNFGASVAHAETKTVSYEHNESVDGKISDFKKMVAEGKDLSDKLVIISTNDVHGAIQKYPYVASLKNFFKNELNADVLLVDSGDFSQDKNPEHNNEDADSANCMEPSEGLAGVEAMNAAGYDIATLGNHEFESFVKLDKNLSKAKFKVICSNLVTKDARTELETAEKNNKNDNNALMNTFNSLTEKDYFCAPSYTYNSSKTGIKVGFFGLLTGEANINNISAKKLKDSLALSCAKYQINSLGDNGADIIICLSHLGLEDDRGDHQNRSIDIYNAVKNDPTYKANYPLDLVLDGHSHTLISSGGNGEPIMSGKYMLQYAGITIIGKDTDGKSKIEKSVLVSLDDMKENLGPDEEANATITNIINSYNPSFFGGTPEKTSKEKKSNRSHSDSKRRKSA